VLTVEGVEVVDQEEALEEAEGVDSGMVLQVHNTRSSSDFPMILFVTLSNGISGMWMDDGPQQSFNPFEAGSEM
jgi:hypothetical protein